MVQFTVTQPTLSVAATQSLVESEEGELGVTIPLYCVRPDGIQQYTLDPALCYAGTCSSVICELTSWLCCDLVAEGVTELCGARATSAELERDIAVACIQGSKFTASAPLYDHSRPSHLPRLALCERPIVTPVPAWCRENAGCSPEQGTHRVPNV